MQEIVNAPLGEVGRHQQHHELRPPGPRSNPGARESGVELGHPQHGDVAKEHAQVLAIEDEIGNITQPAGAEQRLLAAAWPKAFERDK